MAAKRVLVVHNPYEVSGGEDSYIESLVESYRSIGMRVECYPANRAFSLVSPGAALSGIFGEISKDLKNKITNDSIVHLNNIFPVPGPALLVELSRRKIPTIMTVHNHRFFCTNGLALRNQMVCKDCFHDRLAWRPLLYNCNDSYLKTAYHSMALSRIRFGKLYKRAVHQFIAPSPYVKAELLRWGLEDRRVRVVAHPVPLFKSAEPAKGQDIIFAGRFSEEKGVLALLGAAELLPGRQFLFVGDGPLRTILESSAARLPNIKILNQQSRGAVRGLMAGARLAVLPSQCHETFSLFAVEAMSAGTSCLVPNLESTRWLSEKPFCGILADMGSSESIVRSIEEFFNRGKSPGTCVDDVTRATSIEAYSRALNEIVHAL